MARTALPGLAGGAAATPDSRRRAARSRRSPWLSCDLGRRSARTAGRRLRRIRRQVGAFGDQRRLCTLIGRRRRGIAPALDDAIEEALVADWSLPHPGAAGT